MQVRSAQEAVYIACEMERGAVQLYERALALADSLGLTDAALLGQLKAMLADETRHLEQFRLMYDGLDEQRERALTLSATASAVLFPGGLMGAVRAGLLQNAPALLRFAADAERVAAATYRDFAAQSDGSAAETLSAIAAEEDKHLDVLAEYERLHG